jgi:hypothetical protein
MPNGRMLRALGACLNSDVPSVLSDQEIEALRRDLGTSEPTEAIPTQHERLSEGNTTSQPLPRHRRRAQTLLAPSAPDPVLPGE